MEHAGDFHHHVLDSNILAHGIHAFGEQSVRDRGADHDHLAGLLDIEWIGYTAEMKWNVFLDLEVLIRNAVDGSGAVLALERHRAVMSRAHARDHANTADL